MACSADRSVPEKGRWVTPAGIIDPPRRLVIDTVPDREEEAVLLLHLERVVEG